MEGQNAVGPYPGMMRPDPFSRLMHRRAGEHGPVMLMYHAISAGKTRPQWPWAVSIAHFREQLDFLAAEGYATPTMRDLAETPDKWTSRTAVITFDDGYADNLAALEALQARGMRASWFVVTGSIGQAPRWRENGHAPGRLLDASELREMHAAGMEIGSHTVSHQRLPLLADAQLMRELGDSKAALEDLLGTNITSFAYPYGAWDERCAAAVADAGYGAACTTRTGWALRDGDPFRLRRLTVFNSDNVSTLARKLYLGDNAARWRDVALFLTRRLRKNV